MLPPPKTRSPSPKLPYLLLVVLTILPLLYGRVAHAQTIIDVAVFYTPAAKNHQGGTEQIKTKIDEIIAATNTAYTNSSVNQQLNLVAAEEVRYTERNLVTDRNRLQDPSDGYMDEVHTTRERVWADVVMLLRYKNDIRDFGGESYRVVPITASNAPAYAFGVVGIDRTLEDLGTVGYSATATFAHELGRATIRVTTLGQEFLRGAEGECVVADFPAQGQRVLLERQQNQQNFVIVDVE